MEPPDQRQVRIIARRARRALIQARYAGIHVDWFDLLDEGFYAYVKARKRYEEGHESGASFDTYLGRALENSFINLLRRERKYRNHVPIDATVPNGIAPDHIPEPSPGTETELMELVQHYCALLERRIDKEVLIERVFPNALTLTIAKIENLRAAHLTRAGLTGRQSPTRDVGISIDTLSRSLRYSKQQIKVALVRIRKVLREDFNGN